MKRGPDQLNELYFKIITIYRHVAHLGVLQLFYWRYLEGRLPRRLGSGCVS